ncbi:unnamed protein product [Rotaria magnacalcarata]|uniref:Uncharacterized protein n=1 Tax=Rotaria magnacalcarata TaxID=392030 RepID=A0A816ZZG7_9BILA|nr:unnamed protein product [Rotaria magnacalcarata]
MPPTTSTNIHHVLVKRQLLRFNLGGQEQNPDISGHKNQVMYGSAADSEMKLTLLRKVGHQAGRILKGGTDVVIAPVTYRDGQLQLGVGVGVGVGVVFFQIGVELYGVGAGHTLAGVGVGVFQLRF